MKVHMKAKLLPFILFVSFFLSSACWANETILLSLPQSIIADAISKSLPIAFPQDSETITGTIAVSRVEDLTFSDQTLSARISLSGRDMRINTSFGSQQIRVNVGNVDLGFSVSATTRYDKTSRTLLLHPVVSGIEEQGSQNGEIGTLMVALFNDQDIPIPLDRLEPIITDIGSRRLVIDTQVENVVVKPGKLKIFLLPRTTVSN